MGNRMKNNIIFLILLILSILAGCDYADMKGMFIANDPVNQRFEQSMEWNGIHPFREISVPADNYTILTIGDSHVGETENLDIFLHLAKEQAVEAVVMVGDITNGNEEDYTEFNKYLPLQDSLVSFLIPGNHDLYFSGWNSFFSLFGSSVYYFSILTPDDKDLFICLDTGSGTLGEPQLDWFKDVLTNIRPDYRRCIVLTHNNLFRLRRTSSTNPLVEELHVLLDLFLRHEVDMVITGHDHVHDSQVFGNTTHIVMDALKVGIKNAGYFELNITNGTITYSFKNI